MSRSSHILLKVSFHLIPGNKTVDLQKAGKKVLFAFEEAIGFMFSPTVLDKDGVSAACHLATMRCYVRQHENISLTQKLNKIYETYGYHSTIVSYYLCYDPELIKRIFERIRYINGDKDESVCIMADCIQP